jgi:hypothetical protein
MRAPCAATENMPVACFSLDVPLVSRTPRAVLDALRERRTLTIDRDGRPYGDAELIRLAEANGGLPRSGGVTEADGWSRLSRGRRSRECWPLCSAASVMEEFRPAPRPRGSVVSSATQPGNPTHLLRECTAAPRRPASVRLPSATVGHPQL